MSLRDMTRFEWVRQNADEPILDAGCGDSAYFNEDIDFIGIDVERDSPDMQGSRPEEFILGDVQDMPFNKNEFNTVVLAEVLEHVDNPIAAIMEAKRVASNKVIITVPDERRWLPEANPEEHEDHKRVYSGRKLFDQCLKAGFDEGSIKIDHLNELPFAFWLATCDVVPDSILI